MCAFDFIILGAGSAGCMLSSRCSELRSVRVLLLEAGGPDTREDVRVANRYYQLRNISLNPDVDWQFSTEPEKEAGYRRIPRDTDIILVGLKLARQLSQKSQ